MYNSDNINPYDPVVYKKKFAIWPVRCSDGSFAWLVTYYKKYMFWGIIFNIDAEETYANVDHMENITEAEYMVRKLSEKL